MSKDKNYIVVLGGMIIIIGIIVFACVKYFIFGVTNMNSAVLDFLLFTIPSILGTSLIIVSILNLNEKRELKQVIKLNTELSTKFVTKLDHIETMILEIRQNEIDQEEEALKKEKEHIQVHKKMDSEFEKYKTKLDDHIENHS